MKREGKIDRAVSSVKEKVEDAAEQVKEKVGTGNKDDSRD